MMGRHKYGLVVCSFIDNTHTGAWYILLDISKWVHAHVMEVAERESVFFPLLHAWATNLYSNAVQPILSAALLPLDNSATHTPTSTAWTQPVAHIPHTQHHTHIHMQMHTSLYRVVWTHRLCVAGVQTVAVLYSYMAAPQCTNSCYIIQYTWQCLCSTLL